MNKSIVVNITASVVVVGFAIAVVVMALACSLKFAQWLL